MSGAELLVKGASRLASLIKISPLIVGLTIVAFGTSAPELAVSIRSALYPEAGANIALGNVVGSNIFNVLFILGVSSVIAPLTVAQKLVQRDVPIMIIISVLLLVLAMDGVVGHFDGILLTVGIVIYLVFAFYQERNEPATVQEEYEKEYGGFRRGAYSILLYISMVIAGLGALVLGSGWLVEGAVGIAKTLGVSDLVIGLTIVSAGTSLPEVATSIIATIRGERDIAVGNVIGSNIFNILAVVGISAMVSRNGINAAQAAIYFDIPFMIAVAVACLPVFFTGSRISRWEGLVFIAYYICYTTYLALKSGQHDLLQAYSKVMFLFVIPITVLTLIITFIYELKKRHDKF